MVPDGYFEHLGRNKKTKTSILVDRSQDAARPVLVAGSGPVNVRGEAESHDDHDDDDDEDETANGPANREDIRYVGCCQLRVEFMTLESTTNRFNSLYNFANTS